MSVGSESRLQEALWTSLENLSSHVNKPRPDRSVMRDTDLESSQSCCPGQASEM